MKGLLALALTLGAIGAPGCGREGREVVIYTSVDQLFSEPALRDFEAASGVRGAHAPACCS